MGKITTLLALLFTHPNEFRILVQFYLYYEQKRDITAQQEHPTSGWDRQSMRRCWEFLDQTSRSFSPVIKELDGDLARTICMFYLVLRGLDTIEDDMTISDDIKQSLLRLFHEKTVIPGWSFDGNGPNEKDRNLLVEYSTVVEEVNRLAPEYKSVILDICQKMATGMADYAHKVATTGSIRLETVAEYDLYCHYVAGLVGEGLSGFWSASGKEAPWLRDQLELSSSMGLLLQKTNIIRDYKQDVGANRFFWPREIWGTLGFTKMEEIGHSERRALWAQSAMVLDALRHATDALDYLMLVKTQSIFNFCAIPQTMAMATLTLCFMNPDVFRQNVKIRKAEAVSLIMKSTNPREVCYLFRDYARKIHAKAVPEDPHFLRISVACGKIEQWCEHHYPSFVDISSSQGGARRYDTTDVRTRIIKEDEAHDADIARHKRLREIRTKFGSTSLETAPVPEQGFPWELAMYVVGAFGIVLASTAGVVYTVLYFLD